MIMNQNDLRDRTRHFSLRIIKLTNAIPDSLSGRTIGKQIICSGTYVGADYRAACRSKSDRDFLNKMIIVEEEADETCFWPELLIEASLMSGTLLEPLLKEANELTAIFTASGKTIRNKINKQSTKTKVNPEPDFRNPE